MKNLAYDDFNAEESEPCLLQFLYEYNAKNIVRKTLILKVHRILDVTNNLLRFHNTVAISNEFYYFHKMIITLMKMALGKHR